MKRLLFITMFSCLTLSCKNEKNNAELNIESTEMSFQVKTADIDDLEIFEDGIIPWISIKNPESEINNLINNDEVVIDKSEVILIIDYPLESPIEIKLISDNSKGFTKKELIQKISSEYNRIYLEEEETSVIKTIPLKDRKGLINRNKTDGKYGIWGHDIDDLDLSGVIISKSNDGNIKLELMIES